MLPRSTWSDLHSAHHTGPSVEEGEREGTRLLQEGHRNSAGGGCGSGKQRESRGPLRSWGHNGVRDDFIILGPAEGAINLHRKCPRKDGFKRKINWVVEKSCEKLF